MADSILNIIINAVDKASAQFNKVKQSTEQLSKSQLALKAAFKLAQTAAIAAGTAFLRAVPALTKEGIAIGKAQKALEGYTGSAQEAERWTKAVEAASGNTINRFDAMQQATRFAAMGLAKNADEAGKLAQMAITLGATMGKEATPALEEFALMLANQSILRLDTFGISGAAVRARMEELAQQTGETDRQILFLNATMEMGTQKLEQLGAAGFEAADNTQRLSTEVENAKQRVSSFLANGLMPWIDGIYGVVDAHKENTKRIAINTDTYEEYTEQIKKSQAEAGLFSLAVQGLTEDEWENERRLVKLQEQHGIYDRALQASQGNIGYLISQGLDPLSESFGQLEDDIVTADLAMQEYTKQLLFNLAAENMDAEAALVLADAMGLVDHGTVMAAEGVRELTADYDKNHDGVVDATEATEGYYAEVLKLNQEIRSMQDKTVTVTVRVAGADQLDKVSGISGTGVYVSGKRADGGPVAGGRAYIIGEEGPELFVPRQSGYILPNQAIETSNVANYSTVNNFAINMTGTGQAGQDVLSSVRMLEMIYGNA